MKMILLKTVTRFFHSTSLHFAAEKSHLASLRKKTGYTFANCKKALELHNNDIQKAEEWLKQQAQTLGWSKATKLEGRSTTQGLIGVSVHKSDGVMVEINCETDFVAKNKEFQKVVEEATNTCLAYAQSYKLGREPVTKICLDAEQLKSLKARDGKSLNDHLALMIGTVGENAALKRAICLKTAEGIHLTGYAHPSGNATNNVHFGRLAGLVALKAIEGKTEEGVGDVGKKLCQHVVGMNPKKIGGPDDEPSPDKDEEPCLIHQEYLLDDDLSIKELLEENQVEVIDFKRFECGESLSGFGDQPLEYVETCQ